MTAFDCDVLVVGAGPTGVTLGLLLARRGVRTLVIDKEAEIYPLPRAAHIDHETVRIFQELGVADEIMATCRPVARYDFLTANSDILLRFDGADRIGPGGWPASNMVHQPSIEAALRRAASSLEPFELRIGVRFQSFSEDGDGVRTVVTQADGEATIRSRFIVGADGARSLVRTAAGIEVDDLRFDEPWLVIDTLVQDASRLPDANLQICDPARPTTCVLMGASRHRWEFMLKPGETPEQMLDDAMIASLLAPWKVDGAVTLERKAVYRFNARVAAAWRKGRVLLAGDAAHQMPPFAGQGMCSGIRDAANLAWKIAAVLDGADARLLDTYQVEREPHVRAIIGMAMMMGATVCITDPEAAAARDARMIAARAAGQAPDGALRFPAIAAGCIIENTTAAGAYFPQAVIGDAKLDDALGDGPWLLTRDHQCAAAFHDDITAWLDAHQAAAVLVRPDRTVFGAGDADSLRAAWLGWGLRLDNAAHAQL